MLSMFSTSSNESSNSEMDSSVLSQLEAMQRAQQQQANLMRTLESRISEVVDVARFGPKTPAHGDGLGSGQFDVVQRGISRRPYGSVAELRRPTRKASWVWDPQVQKDLENNFESLHRKKVTRRFPTTRSLFRTASGSTIDGQRSSRSDGSGSQRSARTTEADVTASCESTGTEDTSSTVNSASKLLAKWARVKSARQTTFAGLQRSGRALKGLFSSERQPTRGAATKAPKARRVSMRSSWLFRQRAAGRVGRKEEGGHPCAILCRVPCFKVLPVVAPNSLLIIVVDLLNTVAVAYIATLTPLQTAFTQTFDASSWHCVNFFIELLFIFNIALRFRRGFNHDGVYVSDPVFIAMHYFRGDFATDAIAGFPCAA